MSRLVQSTLVPETADAWLALLRDESRIVTLASNAPTLTLRLLTAPDTTWVRHELVHGFFRTSWTSRLEKLDTQAGVLVASLDGALFASFRHEMRWESTAEGLIVRSDLWWEGARPSLESILSQALVRFPSVPGQAPRFADKATVRMVIDARALGAA